MRILGRRSVASALRLWVDILFWIVAVTAVLYVGTGVIDLLRSDPDGFEIEVPVLFRIEEGAVGISPARPGVGEARIGLASADAAIVVADRTIAALYLGTVAVAIAVVGFVLLCLRRIFGSLVTGEPFSPGIAGRIRWIGLIVLAGEVVGSLLAFVIQRHVRASFNTQGLTFQADMALDLTTVFVGMVLLVLAEVFRIGCRLREDGELTI